MKITRRQLRQIINEELLLEEANIQSIAAGLMAEIPWKKIVSDERVIKFILKNGLKLITKYLKSINFPDRSLSAWIFVLYHLHKRDALEGAFHRGFKDGLRIKIGGSYKNIPGAGEELSDETSNVKIAMGAPSGIHTVVKKIADSLDGYA